MQYIGILGHRGSGKTSVSYLLGCCLEYMKRGYTKEQLSAKYSTWCNNIKTSPNAIYDDCWDYVYFDSFGETPNSFVAQLLGIDMSILDNDTLKDSMYVNLKDFTLHTNVDENSIVTSKEYLATVKLDKPKCIRRVNTDSYMTIRDFVSMFSIDIMQRYYGTNVWIKSRIRSDAQYNYDCGWRIFSDVKTGDEFLYISEKNGILIRVQRPSNKKKNKGITNIESEHADYEIVIETDITDLFEEIYKIAKDIYER